MVITYSELDRICGLTEFKAHSTVCCRQSSCWLATFVVTMYISASVTLSLSIGKSFGVFGFMAQVDPSQFP